MNAAAGDECAAAPVARGWQARLELEFASDSPLGTANAGAASAVPVGGADAGAASAVPVGGAAAGTTSAVPVGSANAGVTSAVPVGSANAGAASARTKLIKRRHEGPLLVQKPFYPESRVAVAGGSDPCHVCLIHPPGGIAGGDDLQLDVVLHPGSHALLTTPAAGKYYRRGSSGEASMRQSFDVRDGCLEWLPQENIFYPDADVDLRTVVRLSRTARFIGWEIGCLGLPAHGLSLQGGKLRLGFELWCERRPLLLERLNVGREALATRWGMAGHAAFGTALFHPATVRELDAARAAALACGEVVMACTLVDGVLACRALAHRADHLKRAFVRVWSTLRPLLLGREPVEPRIWAT